MLSKKLATAAAALLVSAPAFAHPGHWVPAYRLRPYHSYYYPVVVPYYVVPRPVVVYPPAVYPPAVPVAPYPGVSVRFGFRL